MMGLVKSLFRIKTMKKTTFDTFRIIDRRAVNTKTYECSPRSSFIIHDV